MKKLGLLLFFLMEALPQQTLPGGVVTGQLRGSDGTPAAGVRVAALDAATSDQRALVSIGRTDELGRYRLEGLPAGRYWIIAGSLVSPTYYPGTAEPRSARAVAVAVDAPLDRVDFRIVAPLNGMSDTGAGPAGDGRRLSINGRFMIEGGGKLPGLFGDFHVWYGAASPLVSPDGTFRIPVSTNPEYVTVEIYGNRLIGDYYIQSITYGSLDLLKNPLVLTETAPGIDVTLAPGSHISGRVHTAAGAPAELTLYLIPTVPVPAPGRPDLLRLANTDAEGHFDLFGVAPGEYRLSSVNDMRQAREAPAITVPDDVLDLRLVVGPDRSLRHAP